MKQLRIATRRSRLALVQAHAVAEQLGRLNPGMRVDLVEIITRGDRDQSPSLAAVGGKGAFIEALEEALEEGRADIAVHSMKDVPAVMPAPFALSSFGPRADVRDALVARQGTSAASLVQMPAGTRVGTASIRRRAMLASLHTSLDVLPVRGNVETRLRRLDAGDFDALLLASAGLDRLGLAGRIGQRIAADILVPAPGQGALAVQYVAERRELGALLAAGTDADVERCIAAERQLTRRLGADCGMPLGAHCTASGSSLRLQAAVADASGAGMLRVELVGGEPLALGDEVAERLQALGVADLLNA